MDPLTIYVPDYVCDMMGALEEAGFEAWCVGGCVRDAVLGRKAHDFDLATSAPWSETERVLEMRGTTVHRTGAEHGTVTAVADGHAVEITTYRADGAYSDGRHPDSVSFVSSIEEDLSRRDFTVNALAYHPERGLLDCHGGLADLEAGTLRVVGDPEQRFSEDALRILRGCRFASQLGFAIDDATMQAMLKMKTRLLNVSGERIVHELDALLLGDYAHDALMRTVDVLVAVLPELAACKGFEHHSLYHCYDVWEHTAWTVQYSPATRLNRWAALLHDIGKPGACFFEGSQAHFYGHAKLSALLAREIMGRLPVSPSFARDVVTLVRIHDDQIATSRRSVRRALSKLDGNVELFRALLKLKRADSMAHAPQWQERAQVAAELERILDDILAEDDAFTVRQLAISGNDVLALGVQPGPEVGSMLGAALDAVLDDRVPNNRGALLEFLETLKATMPEASNKQGR